MYTGFCSRKLPILREAAFLTLSESYPNSSEPTHTPRVVLTAVLVPSFLPSPLPLVRLTSLLSRLNISSVLQTPLHLPSL